MTSEGALEQRLARDEQVDPRRLRRHRNEPRAAEGDRERAHSAQRKHDYRADCQGERYDQQARGHGPAGEFPLVSLNPEESIKLRYLWTRIWWPGAPQMVETAILAVSAGIRRPTKPPPRWRYAGITG